jgi:hypothetical protein
MFLFTNDCMTNKRPLCIFLEIYFPRRNWTGSLAWLHCLEFLVDKLVLNSISHLAILNDVKSRSRDSRTPYPPNLPDWDRGSVMEWVQHQCAMTSVIPPGRKRKRNGSLSLAYARASDIAQGLLISISTPPRKKKYKSRNF